MSDVEENKVEEGNIMCQQCGRPAIIKYDDAVPLCANCYQKMAQANFMEQQANHNRLSWNAARLNFVEQQLYAGSGGILPLQQMQIPQPPSAGINYSYSNIQVSDSAVGAISSGDLYALNTSIEVIKTHGETELAISIKELSEAIINSNDIQAENQNEILKLITYLSTEASQNKEKRNNPVITTVLEKLSTVIPAASMAWSIWERIEPLLKSNLGG